MDSELNDLVERLRQLEEEFEQKIEAQRATFRYQLEKGRVVFEQSVIAEHLQIKTGLIRFLRGSTIGCLLSKPAHAGVASMRQKKKVVRHFMATR